MKILTRIEVQEDTLMKPQNVKAAEGVNVNHQWLESQNWVKSKKK